MPSTSDTAHKLANVGVEILGPDIERTIRDLAANVINAEANNRSHPSYGYTKGDIYAAFHRLEGAVGLYMVLMGQAQHPNLSGTAVFRDHRTTERFDSARTAFLRAKSGRR